MEVDELVLVDVVEGVDIEVDVEVDVAVGVEVDVEDEALIDVSVLVEDEVPVFPHAAKPAASTAAAKSEVSFMPISPQKFPKVKTGATLWRTTCQPPCRKLTSLRGFAGERATGSRQRATGQRVMAAEISSAAYCLRTGASLGRRGAWEAPD